MNTPERGSVSIVIPVFNEAENLEELCQEITAAAGRLDRPFEIIFIDDGSTDGSWPILAGLQKKDPQVKIIRLRKNFGQTAALVAGFDYAGGDIIISLDADLQNDPDDIPRLIGKLEEGYDIVSGWRKNRQDRFLSRRVPSAVANWLISRITRVRLHDYGCSLKAFRREVVKNIRLYGELHRFIPAIASNMGVAIAEVKVHHRARRHGKSKYNIFKFTRVILDTLTVKFLLSYSTRPLQIFGLVGMASGLLGFIIALWLSYQRLVLKLSVANRPLLLLSVLLIVIGIQFITLGLLAEIMVRAYHESSGKAIYFIREIIDGQAAGERRQNSVR
jgi:glycosyltransferase involved in cell wall biosynthesis